MVFTAKKVETLLSFGEKIKKAREEAGLSKEKIAQILNIRIWHLERLENEEIEKLPADVYVNGILRKYAKILGLDPETLLAEYEKEAKFIRHLGRGKQQQSLPRLPSSRFVITPRIFSFSLSALIFLLVAGYLFYQLNFLISPPKLSIAEFPDGLITDKTSFLIKGKTEPGARLTINNQETYINRDGNFEQLIDLNQGINSIKIKATNRFGKSNSIVRRIMVK